MQIEPKIKKTTKEKKDKPLKVDTNTLTKGIIDFVNFNGGFAMRVNTQGQFDSKLNKFRKSGSTKGISDILYCYKGLFFAVEVKVGYDKLNENQIAFKSNFEKAGGIFFECRNIDIFIQFFNKHKTSICN